MTSKFSAEMLREAKRKLTAPEESEGFFCSRCWHAVGEDIPLACGNCGVKFYEASLQ